MCLSMGRGLPSRLPPCRNPQALRVKPAAPRGRRNAPPQFRFVPGAHTPLLILHLNCFNAISLLRSDIRLHQVNASCDPREILDTIPPASHSTAEPFG